MPYNPMPDDYRERIKIARERLDLTSGDQYELKVLREEIEKLETENRELQRTWASADEHRKALILDLTDALVRADKAEAALPTTEKGGRHA